MNDLLTQWVLPLLIYSGPILPIIAVALYTRRRNNKSVPYKKAFKLLLAIHLIAFLPFVYGMIMRKRDALHALLFPALTGVISLITAAILLIAAMRKMKQDNITAEQGAAADAGNRHC